MLLEKYGWNNYFESCLNFIENGDQIPARIICQHQKIYIAVYEKGEIHAEISGNFIYHANFYSDYPSVGDWVQLKLPEKGNIALIISVLQRKNFISRNVAGSHKKIQGHPVKKQIIASNIDIVFIVSSLDRDYNLRRIERYLALAYNSGAMPVIILNKSDLCDNPEIYKAQVHEIAFGVPIIVITATDRNSIQGIKEYVKPKKTIVLLGSSGVGKSTIINTLMDNKNRLKVNAISSAVNKGVHTTTHRELFILSNGGIIIDNPGMRELSFYKDEEGISNVFKDIEILSTKCNFHDCQHKTEPDCAVKNAIEKKILSSDRLNSYNKLKKEMKYIEDRKDKSTNAIEKLKWKDIKKVQKKLKKFTM